MMGKKPKNNLLKVFNQTFGTQIEELSKWEPGKWERYSMRPFYKRYPFWLWFVFQSIVMPIVIYIGCGTVSLSSITLGLVGFTLSELLDISSRDRRVLLRKYQRDSLKVIFMEHFMELFDLGTKKKAK